MDGKIVGTIMVESSKIPAFTALAKTLGVPITFEKPIKFEELEMVEFEKGQYQCLLCWYEFLKIFIDNVLNSKTTFV